MRWPVAVFAGWVALGLDVGMGRHLAPGQSHVAPSFVLPLVVFVALNAPAIPTMWTAFLLGLFLDLTSFRGESATITVGPHVFGMLAAAYLVQTLRGVMMRKSIVALVVLSIPAKLLAGVVTVFLLTLRSMYTGGLGAGVEFGPMGELWRALLSALVTGFSAAAVGAVLIPLHGVFHFHDASGRRYVTR